MPIDTAMYQNGPNHDPMTQIVEAVKLRNALGNINKIRGGMPGTGSALDSLGASQPYPQPYVGSEGQ
jgi:hypothetical protein